MTDVNPSVGTPGSPGFYTQFAEPVTTFVDEAGGNGEKLAHKIAETVNVRDFGAVGDGTTDDTAAVQGAIDSFGNTTTHRAGRVVMKGKFLLTSPLIIERRTLFLEGTGWEIKNGTTGGTLLEWGGAAGVPMIRFQGGNWGGGLSKVHILGNTTNVPSAAISLLRDASEPAPNSLLRFEDLFIGPMAGYDGTEVASDYFTNGIIAEGTDTNNDMSVWDNIYIRRAATGIKLTGTQNVGHNFRDMRVIKCGIGFDSISRVMGQSWYFMENTDTDLYVHGNGFLTLFRFASEFGHRFARLGNPAVPNVGHIAIRGGQWQRNSSFMATDDVIVESEHAARASLKLEDFEFTSLGTPDIPIIRMKGPAGVGVRKAFIAKQVSNIDNTWLDMPLTNTASALDQRHIEIERHDPDFFHFRNLLRGSTGNTTISTARYDHTESISST